MKNIVFNYLATSNNTLSMQGIIMNFVAATVIGVIIFFCYMITHSRAVYSAKFNVSLIMMTVITTLVMSVIGNNVALSLGMVGALSIVRFRTAIKDVRDTVYIFWSIAVGICCGVSEYLLVGIGSFVVFCVLVILGTVHNDDVYLISIRGTKDVERRISELMISQFNDTANIKVNNSTRESCELIYEISRKNLMKYGGFKIKDKLYDIDSVSIVNIMCQSEEISK